MRIRLFAGLAVAFAFGITWGQTCPDLWLLRGDAEWDGAFDLVFVPAGFGAGSLAQYRCAVDELSRVLDEEPFASGSCRYNVFRAELEGGGAGFATSPTCAACGPPTWSTTCSEFTAYAGPEGALVTGSNVPERNVWDPEVRCCWTGFGSIQDELSMPSERLSELVGVATCARSKPPDAVVVVANATGSLGVAYRTDPPVVLVTLDGIFNTGAVNRLAHELGHVFRLLDESDVSYASRMEGPMPAFLCDRNVAAVAPPAAEPLRTETSGCVGVVPWTATCSPIGTDPGSCESVPSLEACRVTANTEAGCGACAAPAAESGLVEGAFYHSCGFFRPSSKCRMRSIGEHFCPVCSGLVDRELASFEPVPGCEGRDSESSDVEMELRSYRAEIGYHFLRPPRPHPSPRPPNPPFLPLRELMEGVRVSAFIGVEDLGGLQISVELDRLEIDQGLGRRKLTTLLLDDSFPFRVLRWEGPPFPSRPPPQIDRERSLGLGRVKSWAAYEARTGRRFVPTRVIVKWKLDN